MMPPSSNGAAPVFPEPLEVGVAAIERSGTGASRKAASNKLVKQALRNIHTDQLPVRCALLLATADWCHTPATLPREVRSTLKKTLGYPVPLIGGSMARLFCSSGPKHLIEHGLILVTFCSRDLWVTVASLREPHKAGAPGRKAGVMQLANDLRARAGIRLGASAARHLLGFFPGIFLDKRGEQVYCDNELHEEILNAFNYQLRVIGGAAADDLRPTVGYQFANDACLKSGLALALVETDLAWSTMMGHGFTPDRGTCVSVGGLKDGTASGYDVSMLDGKPADTRLEELRKASSARSTQLLFGVPDGRSYHIVCSLDEKTTSCDHIRLNRKVKRGERLHLLKADASAMTKEARAIVKGAIRGTGTKAEHVKLIWGLSCTGRFDLYDKLGLKWQDVIGVLRRACPDALLVGGLCAGEFGIDRWRRSESNNFSFWTSCIASAYSPRGDTRVLQKKLLAAAERLSSCQTPKDVMESALKGAVKCGTTGGQICLVDYATHRILGLHLGYAVSRPDSGQDWSEVLALTNRPAPKEVNGGFPRYLLNYSLPVDQNHHPKVLSSIPREQDILTLIVRTHQAVFVADSKRPIFHCDRKAANAGDIVRFLAIPLVGSAGKAIATLQLGLTDDFTLNRECFFLWLGYAQKVAAALERAQEAQERTTREKMSAIGNRFMQTTLEANQSVTSWCDEFLRELIEQLGADGAHMRLLDKGPSGKQGYCLVSAVGHLAKLRFRTRPVTHTNHGSCNLNVLRKGGRLTNTKKETAKLNRNVRAVAAAGPSGRLFLRGLRKIQSTALLPLIHGETVLGSFVVDGLSSYLFTERNARIVRAAAEQAGAVLCRKNADRDLLQFDRERSVMFNTLVSATEGTADQRLRKAIEHLCSAMEVDVASVFVWHNEIQKLVLHTAHKWHKQMEGEANYALGQGWTGSIATSGDHVSLICAGVPGVQACSRRYYEEMIPPAHRSPKKEAEPRVGVTLMAGDDRVGVVTFAYYQKHAARLRSNYDSKLKLLDVLRHLITLSVEAARREAKEQRIRQLLDVRNAAVSRLIGGDDGGRNWLDVMEELRMGFRVARASFYPVQNDLLHAGWSATSEDWAHKVEAFRPMLPSGGLRDVAVGGQPIAIRVFSDERLAGWPNSDGINTLYARPVFSSRGAIVGVLEFVNRMLDRDHPFDFFDDSETLASLEVATSLGAALDRRHVVEDLRHHLNIANRIGATTLSAAISMHRLMRHLARLQENILWLALHPDVPRQTVAEKLSKMELDCAQAISMIDLASNTSPAGRRIEDLRSIVRQAVQVVSAELTPAENIKLSVVNALRLLVKVEVFSILHALVNLMTNAVDALPEGGVVEVSTSQSSDGMFAKVCVYNPGRIYLPEEFQKFLLQDVSSVPKRGHLGIGLPLAKMAIEACAGSLNLSFPAQGGVEAIMSLPLTTEA